MPARAADASTAAITFCSRRTVKASHAAELDSVLAMSQTASCSTFRIGKPSLSAMENLRRISAHDARRALDAVVEAKKPLASQSRSPRWLYPVLGLAAAGVVSGMALSKNNPWGPAILVTTVVALGLLPMIPRTKARTRVDAFSHPLNKTVVAIYFVVLACMAAAAIALSHLPWVIVLVAPAAFAWTVTVGLLLDKRLARAFRDGL